MTSETRYSDAAGTTLVATTTFTYDEWGRVTNIITTDSNDDTCPPSRNVCRFSGLIG